MQDGTSSGHPRPATLSGALIEMLDVEAQERSLDLFTGEPARVLAYKPPRAPGPGNNPGGLPARVDVQPLFNRVYHPKGVPEPIELPAPIIPDRPLIFFGSPQMTYIPEETGADLIGSIVYLCPGTHFPQGPMSTGQQGLSHVPTVRHSINNSYALSFPSHDRLWSCAGSRSQSRTRATKAPAGLRS